MTSTNGSNTATVETLAAEVRVLQVGNRQITMSVFKQLDHRPLEEVELFGRVSMPTRGDEHYSEGIEVVGRSTTDGTLVRGWKSNPHWLGRAPAAFYHWLFHTADKSDKSATARKFHGRVGSHGDHHLTWPSGLTLTPHNLRWTNTERKCPLPEKMDGYYDLINNRRGPWTDDEVRLFRWLVAEYEHQRLTGELCDISALSSDWKAAADKQLADLTARQEQYDTLAALPLIVLAGLR